tara:strand:- start:589 stop:867 length:279 start_codon:yes stop_codon:yes gene_type:complete
MSANLNEEFSSTTKQLDTDSLCTVAHEVVRSASESLTGWHPQGTSVSARTEMIVGALDEIVLALGERWRESVDVPLAIEAVWVKLDELNAIN